MATLAAYNHPTTQQQQQRPAPAARASYRQAAPPSVSLSPLTTRSSSSTRLHSLHDPPPTPTSTANSEAYRAWRQESKNRLVQQSAGNSISVSHSSTRAKHGGKGKAVAFVVGAPSSGSGEDGDEESGVVPVGSNDAGHAGATTSTSVRQLTVEEIIKAQIRQPLHKLDALNFDPALQFGIGDYTFVLNPAQSSSSPTPPPASPASNSASSSVPPPHPNRVSLGKGKFSEVLLVKKENVEYALKHTPLHPHHPLIATRLLREPTILAQLLPHPNLVKVFETIRTPGHFYLVEENLRSSITLEQLVQSYPSHILPISLARSVLYQLSSVVQSLHTPLRVCHRDIKPENILIQVIPHPINPETEDPTLVLKLLDFGLATHFSMSEAKLTTCCGSPAYHSPELWRGLREPSGTVKYWGPEVDIWCTGLTLLRCLTPSKYPLGISHSSLSAISDKVIDSLLTVEDEPMRAILAGLLTMDGEKRMKAFETLCAQDEVKACAIFPEDDGGFDEPSTPMTPGGATTPPTSPDQPSLPPTPALTPKFHTATRKLKEFKSTTFIPTDPKFALDLPLISPTTTPTEPGPRPLEAFANDDLHLDELFLNSRPSRSRTRRQPSVPSIARQPSLPSIAHGLPTPPPSSEDVKTPELDSSTVDSSPSTPRVQPSTPRSRSNSRRPPHLRSSSTFSSGSPMLGSSPLDLILLNPTHELLPRAVSYIKYKLRCQGILYHVRPSSSSLSLYPSDSPSPDVPFSNNFNSTSSSSSDQTTTTYLECVVQLPSEPSGEAKTLLTRALATRPTLARSSSTPPLPGTRNGAGGQQKKEAAPPVKVLSFYLSIKRVSASRRMNGTRERIVVSLSDERAVGVVKEALRKGPKEVEAEVGEDGSRGRSRSLVRPSLVTAKTEGSEGLRMNMGRPALGAATAGLESASTPNGSSAGGEGKKGFFDFAFGLTRWGGSQASTPMATE